MKRNLFLFSLLVISLFFTYVFEELGHVQKEKKEDEASRILDFKVLGKLKSFKTANAELVAGNGHFETVNPSYPVDVAKMDALFEILSKIKVRRILLPEESQKLKEEDFFPHKNLWFHFILEKGEVEVLLGKKLEIDSTFYIRMKRSDQPQAVWAIAYDDSPVEGIYSQEEDRTNLAKYQRLTSLLLLKSDFFWDGHPLKGRFDVNKIVLTNTRNRPFEVNLLQKKTSPSILNGLVFSEEGAKEFLEGIFSLRAKKIFLDPGKQKLDGSLAKMVIGQNSNKELVLELFKRFGNQTGYFLKSSAEPSVFEMGQEASRFFYANVQDFWQRTLIEFFTPSFSLQSGNQKFNLKRSEDGRFFSDKEMKVNEITLTQLYNLLSRPADRLEELEKEENPSSTSLVLHFASQTIYFYAQEAELIAYIPTLKVKFHYFAGEMPISLKLMDYFR